MREETPTDPCSLLNFTTVHWRITLHLTSQMYINSYEEKRRRNSGCEVMAVGERSGGGAGPGITIVQQSGQPGWRK